MGEHTEINNLLSNRSQTIFPRDSLPVNALVCPYKAHTNCWSLFRMSAVISRSQRSAENDVIKFSMFSCLFEETGNIVVT